MASPRDDDTQDLAESATTEPDRRILVRFKTLESFRREFAANLRRGGLFLPTNEVFELRELVEIRIELSFRDAAASIRAEVVHVVPPGLSSAGGRRGVGIQFLEPAAVLRPRLLELAGLEADEDLHPDDRRRAPRTLARLEVRVTCGARVCVGRSRNLSTTGILLAIDDDPIPVGTSCRLAIVHPVSSEELRVPARVARHHETGGMGIALGVRFEPSAQEAERVLAFIEEVQAIEHARLGAGIRGAISEVGAANAVQMFAQSGSGGTLTLSSSEDEGTLVFDNGQLRVARLGGLRGVKALERMLAWKTGSFEFHASVESTNTDGAMSLEGALLDALRRIDELSDTDTSGFPDSARLHLDPSALAVCTDDLGKVGNELVVLARAGVTVRQVLDSIDAADVEIYRMLETLREAGAITFDVSNS